MIVSSITDLAAALLHDTQKDWATPEALLPYFQLIYSDCFNELMEINYEFDEAIVEIPALPANTDDLSAYQASGGVLELIVVPTFIDWKPLNDPVTSYSPVKGPIEKLDDVTDMQTPWQWNFRQQIIRMTPCSVSVDIRVGFQQLFNELTSKDSILALNTLNNFFAYRLASLVSDVRENPELANTFGAKGDRQLELICSRYVKEDQRMVRRVGSLAMNRRSQGLRWPGVPRT